MSEIMILHYHHITYFSINPDCLYDSHHMTVKCMAAVTALCLCVCQYRELGVKCSRSCQVLPLSLFS